jgi:adenylylsulfate kinase-like enzyme
VFILFSGLNGNSKYTIGIKLEDKLKKNSSAVKE